MTMVVGRLAPSPTGVLHLGNARSFLVAWLSVRRQGGQLRMRVEDLDSPRVRPGSEGECLRDLEWLGLDWDGPLWRQSDRQGHYAEALRKLCASGDAYPCICSRREVERAASAPHVGEDGPLYPGTCRGRFPDATAAKSASGVVPAYRFYTKPGITNFDDVLQGCCKFSVQEELGDFVIYKRDGQAAYQLAVVIDDAAMGVTEVVRGVDLLPSTARQIQLAKALHLQSPNFCHVPLVVGQDGRRLAKRHGDTSLAAFRAAGFRAEDILGWLAWSLALQPAPSPCRAADLLEAFHWSGIPASDVVWLGDFKAPMQWR